jgi:hypothetical protein
MLTTGASLLAVAPGTEVAAAYFSHGFMRLVRSALRPYCCFGRFKTVVVVLYV